MRGGGGGGGGWRIAICVKDAKTTKIVSIMLFNTNKNWFITSGVVTFGVTIDAKCNNAKCNQLILFNDKISSEKKKRYVS